MKNLEYIEWDIKFKMRALQMTRKPVIELKRNYAYRDGINSANMQNPIHNNWKGQKHFDPDYEKAYWKGYNEALKGEIK